MTASKRPTLARRQTRASKAEEQEQLDQGVAVTDSDGTRLVVRMRDITGKHDADLVNATGKDFAALMELLGQRQGLDVLCAVLWFTRLVHGRATLSYQEMLETFTYQDFFDAEPGSAKDEPEAPQLSGGA